MTGAGRLAILAIVVVAIGISAGFLARGYHEARAEKPLPDPWATSSMQVLGSVPLPNAAGQVSAVRIPGWPLPALCIVLTAPQGVTMRCDGDFPSSAVPPME